MCVLGKKNPNHLWSGFFGAQASEVSEPRDLISDNLIRSEAILQMEFEAYPEPKALSSEDLRGLIDKHGSYAEVGRQLGSSPCFVRQNALKKHPKN